MKTVIIIAAIIVIVAIVVCLVTARDIQRLKYDLRNYQNLLEDTQDRLNQAEVHKAAVVSNLEVLEKVRGETEERIRLRNEKLEELKEERVANREITTTQALRQKSFDEEE